MFPGVTSVFTMAMGLHHEPNKMFGILINPLINGLIVNGHFRVFDGKFPGDKFWRPPKTNVFFDIPSNEAALEYLSQMGFVLISSILDFVRKVIAGINRSGILLKHPLKG